MAVKHPFNKVLVAGRCDRGGITVSDQKIEQYCKERGYSGYIDTSAKTGDGCEELKILISQNIPWDHLPWTATTQLFKTLKDTIIAVKNEGTVLVRVSHLFHRLRDRLKDFRFTEAELRAMLQTFLDRSLCLEEETPEGTMLVFPSYFKRDRPELPGHPAVLTTYRFTGPIDEIYATLVVRLYYTNDFQKDQLWKNAADFKTLGGKQAGFMLVKKADDTAELAVYFEPGVQEDTQVSFIKYIHEHLLKTVERQRSYVCPHCHAPVEAKEAVKIRLERGFKDIICLVCEKRFDLIDSIEQKFASPEFLEKVRAMDEEAERKLDNEGMELILEGQAKAIAGEAGQIYRDVSQKDWGIDAEIEFKDDKGNASGQRVYLQLKSGDSYLYKRKRDQKDIFTIKKKRHAEYWQSHAYPVMLVIRTSDGEIRWMNITDYLRRKGPDTKQVEFEGEAFTADSLCRLRKRLLAAAIHAKK
jgi:hypothetical protein